VKRLARAAAVVVVEPRLHPHGGLLARELKASFCDALTWMPGYPGVGRVPPIREVDGSGSLSVDVLAVDTPRFALGVRLALGYVAASAVPLSGKAERPDDGTLRLQMTQASLGRLDLSGPYAAVSVVSDF
jgi:hypothetical protein